MFKHEFVNLPDLKYGTINGIRQYMTPGGIYPSMSSVISRMLTNDAIKKWRERVGEKEADIHTKMIANRGTAFHKICENYVMNRDSYNVGFMPDAQFLFKQAKPHIDKLNVINAIEACLYTDHFKLAGRCDLIGEYDGELSVVDFKQGSIHEDTIEKNMLQLCGYAAMYYERIGVFPKKLVLLFSHVDDGSQVVIGNTIDYSKKFSELVKNYYLDIQKAI